MRRVTRGLVLLGIALALAAGADPPAMVREARSAHDAPYDIVALDTLDGEWSRAFGINNQGWVAGQAYNAAGEERAVLWKEGEIVDLGTLGGDEATALGVNDLGQVVGRATTAPDVKTGVVGSHAFLWEAGRMRDVGTLGGEESVAQDINSRGQVVGAATTRPGQSLSFFDDGPHAFLWEDGNMTDLGTLGGKRSWASAINDAGQVIGTAQTADGEDHAFLWENGVMTDLGALGGEQAVALAINRHGQVAGGSTTAHGQDFDASGTRAFRWQTGVMTTLGDASGVDSVAYGINDQGGVVGVDSEDGAVIWRGEEAIALAALLPESDEWDNLDLARAINERGQIVGWGQRDGATRAFVASPADLAGMTGMSRASATPTAYIAGLEAAEVVERAQRAVQHAGSYRFEVFALNAAVEIPFQRGEVEIGKGSRTQAGDGSDLAYFDGQTLYTLRPDGTWQVRVPPDDRGDSLLNLLDSSTTPWESLGMESVDGRPSYVIEQILEDGPSVQRTQTFWIDAGSFLPHRFTWQVSVDGSAPFGNEIIYSGFGAPVDVNPPAAALAPTPTPEPLPVTSGGKVTIALRDIYFEPKEVTIPANQDVVIVLRNEGVTTHNFTIDEVGITSGNIEWGTTEHIVVNLPPGVYTFHCDIPGHTEAGQVGTLTVRE